MLLPLSFSTNYDQLYLCYMDPVTNQLTPIDPEALHLKMKPFEKVIRRFYIVKEDILSSTVLTVVVNIDGPQKHAYSVKARLGKIYSDLNSFEYSGNMCTVNTYIAENKYDNAVPVDILIESFNQTETCNLLDISLSHA